MQVYVDYEGPQKETRYAKGHTTRRDITSRCEGTSDTDCLNSQTNKSGFHSNRRIPFGPSNSNAFNMSDFLKNHGHTPSLTRSSIIRKGSSTSLCSITQCSTEPSQARPSERIQLSIQPTNSEFKMDMYKHVAKPSLLFGQEEGGLSFNCQLRSLGVKKKPSRNDAISPRLLRLRTFIKEQRRRRVVVQTEEDSAAELEEVEICKTMLSLPSPRLLDDAFSIDSPNKLAMRRTRIKTEKYPSAELSHPQKVLVGTDICVPPIGQASENDDTASVTTSMTSSETKRSTERKERHCAAPVPTIFVGNFQQSIWLDFGDDTFNTVGRSRSLQFQLRAPESPIESSSSSSFASSVYVDDHCYIVRVENVPVEKGFTLNLLDRFEEEKEEGVDPSIFSIDDGDTRRLTLTWQPVEPGDMCEAMYLKLRRGRIRVIAHGKARDGNKITMVQNKKTGQMQERPISIRENESTSFKTKENLSLGFASCLKKDVLSESLHTISSSSTKILRISPLKGFNKTPHIYNNVQADKQLISYENWLNFWYKNNDGMSQTDSIFELDTVQPGERQTARNNLLRSQEIKTRLMAVSLYRRPDMLDIRYAIELDVENKRLSFRSDPYVLLNVSLRDRLVSLLFSYSLPWLRLGLETIFGKAITSKSLSKSLGPESETQRLSGMRRRGSEKTMKVLLKRFIRERVLLDPDLKMKYTGGKCMTPSGRFEIMYKDEMSRNALKRILLLVVFLDHAKMENMIQPPVLLFNKNSRAKSTKDFLGLLCNDYVHGIGDLSKHLARIGVSVSYTQSHIEELDFSVSSMAMDLRDGARLAKLAEILSGDTKSSILRKLRLPAISRLQKVHNINVVLSAFSNMSIPNIEFVQPNHIVNGHKLQLLQLLWSVISRFNLSKVLDTAKLKLEIDAVHHGNNHYSKQNKGGEGLPSEEYPSDANSNSSNLKLSESCKKQKDEYYVLLLRWCRSVCWSYGVEVTDLSTSFCDGKVICCLIHFYRPNMLRRDQILPTTSDLFRCGLDLESIKKDPQLQQQYRCALKNERHNLALANKRMEEIGGIPRLLSISDSTIIPDKHSIIITTTHLCSRLLDSSKKIRSTVIIQRAFRKKLGYLSEKKWRAVTLIIKTWSKYKLARSEQKLNDYIRSTSNYAILIQQLWRAFMNKRRNSLNKEFSVQKRRAAILITRCWKRYKLKQSEQRLDNYIRSTSNQAIMIQKLWRGFTVKRQSQSVQQNQRCAIMIQKLWRGFSIYFQYQCIQRNQRAAALIIRSWSRYRTSKLSRKHSAAKRIQTVYTDWMLNRRVRFVTNQVIVFQKTWRGFSCRLKYHKYIRCVVLIQKTVRRNFATSVVLNREEAIVRIQCLARCYLAVRKLVLIWTEMDYYHRINVAATKCQAYVRRRIAMERFSKEKKIRVVAATICQAHVRRRIAMKCFHEGKTNRRQCHSMKKGTKRTQVSYCRHKTQILRVRKMDCRILPKSTSGPSNKRKKLRL